ncbi:hypothetical protein PFICI_14535 [Pestalotiopsis fici W106-1]|uniref:Uncharacterized protein n=1 Tax=Pestalotiopsis fici (strain W106-1 / CGMCC3.15140) TaxID=1229662 RepID=W3WIH7_PESFW|nr:uncharacterized protein PFICI_14535 [Pestalotiopsis fici W106-1]ETS73589.1 hypothetical protein PFICI_14535 [Pestalotiopsis fici W106-1]
MAAPTTAPRVPVMDRAQAEKIIVDWRTRADAWREMDDVEALKNFEVIRVAGTKRHSANSLSLLVSEHSYARNTATSSHRMESARERWSRGFAVNVNSGRGMVEQFLEHYVAMIDHDFFSGLLTRPVCGADNVFMATDPLVRLELINKAGTLQLSPSGRIIVPSGARFDPQRKVLTIHSITYNIPEADLKRDWTIAEFMTTDFTRHIEKRALDDLLVSMVQAMLHMYLGIGSCYKKEDSEERKRELRDPHGFGHGLAFWDSFAFITKHLSEWKIGSADFTQSANHSQRQATYWREHWSRHDDLEKLGVDNVSAMQPNGLWRRLSKLSLSILWLLLVLSFGFLAWTIYIDLKMDELRLRAPPRLLYNFLPLQHSLDDIIRMPIPSVAIFLFLWSQFCIIFRHERQSLALSIIQHILLGLGVLVMYIISHFGPPGFDKLTHAQFIAFWVIALITHGRIMLRKPSVEGFDDWYDQFEDLFLGRW